MVAIVAIVAETDSSLSALKKTSRQPVMPLSSSHSHLTVDSSDDSSRVGLFRISRRVEAAHPPTRRAPHARVSFRVRRVDRRRVAPR